MVFKKRKKSRISSCKFGSSIENEGSQWLKKIKRICKVDMEPLTYVMYAIQTITFIRSI